MTPFSNDIALARFEQWMTASTRSDRTIRLRMQHLTRLAANVHLATATEANLAEQLGRTRHLASETRRSILSSWRSFYGWATTRHLIEHNPAALLDPIPERVPIPRVAPDEDIIAALRTATPQVRAMILLARFGCLRLSELTTLHMDAREGDRIRVLGKGSKERIVYLNRPLAEALDALEQNQPHGFYFPGRPPRPGPMHPQSVCKIIKRETGWNPHSLRHAGATAAYRATLKLRAVQDLLGHSNLATTQRYLHLHDDERRAVAEGTLFPESEQATSREHEQATPRDDEPARGDRLSETHDPNTQTDPVAQKNDTSNEAL